MQLLYLLLVLVTTVAGANPTSYTRSNVASVTVHQVVIDPTQVDITIGLPKDGIGHSESFSSITKRTKPLAAITGGFFDTKTLFPIGDVVLDGKILYDGYIGPAFVVLQDGTPQIVSEEDYKQIPKFGLRCAIQTGPTLVKDGKQSIHLSAEGFTSYLLQPALRTAIGLTADHKLVMVAVTSVASLDKLSEIMIQLGCVQAVALDGGASTGLCYDYTMKVHPGRAMAMVILVLPKSLSLSPLLPTQSIPQSSTSPQRS